MKKKFLYILLFAFTLSYAQNEKEQEIYDHKIKNIITISKAELRYIGPDGKIIGYRKINEQDTLYLDKFKRRLHSIPVNYQDNQTQNNNNSNNNSNNTSNANERSRNDATIDSYFNMDRAERTRRTKSSNVPYMVRTRRRVVYYDRFGNKELVVRKSWWRKRITYRDGNGKLLGYKRKKNNGVYKYYDGRRRKIGKSFINANGKMVFEPYRRRMTPAYMLKNLFYID